MTFVEMSRGQIFSSIARLASLFKLIIGSCKEAKDDDDDHDDDDVVQGEEEGGGGKGAVK